MLIKRSNCKDVLFLADPWHTLDHRSDSTIHLGNVASREFGTRCFWATPDAVFFRDGSVNAVLSGELIDGELVPGAIPEGGFLPLSSFHSTHWRVDPPVDMRTYQLWSLLAACDDGARLVNSARALLSWNEKFAPLRFGDWAVPSMISTAEAAWEAFHRAAHGKPLIAKPVGEAASRGVTVLSAAWTGALAQLKHIQAAHGPWVLIQEYDPTIASEGETRVFLVAGQVAGALRKCPRASLMARGHFVMNMDAPEADRPILELCEPASEQAKRARAIGKALAADGVHIATVDFIGDRILEINVTSPGLIRWLDERAGYRKSIARRYWQALKIRTVPR